MAQAPWTPEPVPSYQPGPQRRGTSGGVIALVVALAVAALLCLVAGAVVLVWRLGSAATPDSAQPADPLPGASRPAAAGSCRWLPSDVTQHTKDVGVPPVDVPRRGAQQLTMTTNRGVVTFRIDTAKAPCTAASITHLAGKGYFDGTKCHRLTTEGISVLQCGDPFGNGMGGPTYRYAEENLPNKTDPALNYPVGTLAMAKTSEPNTTGSQFFIVWGPTPLPGQYTVLGTVTAGLDVIKAIGAEGAVDPSGQVTADGAPKNPVTITSITVTPAA